MKAFFSISLLFLAMLPEMNSFLQVPNKINQTERAIIANPWKQVNFTVSPAVMIDEELGITATNLHELQDEDTRNRILKFDDFGNYQIVLGQSAVGDDMLFASRNGAADGKDDKPLTGNINVTEQPTVNILESGSWFLDDDDNLVLVSDNGRMKEEVLQIKQVSANRMVISFTKIIEGEEHTFKQVFESQPFIDLGW